MDILELAFLVLLMAGIAALLGGIYRTRMNWRADIQPYGRGTSAVDVLLHPDRYAAESSLRGIRILNETGIILLIGAVSMLAWRAIIDILRASL